MAAVDNVEHQQQGITILRKRERRQYGYQSVFGEYPWTKISVPYIHNMATGDLGYLTRRRRKYLEHTYPHFFMNTERIPTGRWECEDHDTSATWTCN